LCCVFANADRMSFGEGAAAEVLQYLPREFGMTVRPNHLAANPTIDSAKRDSMGRAATRWQGRRAALRRRRPLRHRPQSRRSPLPLPLRNRAHRLDRYHAAGGNATLLLLGEDS
jgi:hypothetical protein